MNTYKIEVQFEHLELITIASMCYMVHSWPKEKHQEPIYTAFIKISLACWPLLTKEEKKLLRKTLKSVKDVFGNPSLERGMVLGGMEVLMNRIDEEIKDSDENA